MNEQEFKERTKKLALRVIKLVDTLPDTRAAGVISRQLLRCGTSVGANYRSACRARSVADVIAKLAIVEEEADETLYWMELIVECGLLPSQRLAPIMKETDEILAMTVASIKTLRRRTRADSQSKIQNQKSKMDFTEQL